MKTIVRISAFIHRGSFTLGVNQCSAAQKADILDLKHL